MFLRVVLQERSSRCKWQNEKAVQEKPPCFTYKGKIMRNVSTYLLSAAICIPLNYNNQFPLNYLLGVLRDKLRTSSDENRREELVRPSRRAKQHMWERKELFLWVRYCLVQEPGAVPHEVTASNRRHLDTLWLKQLGCPLITLSIFHPCFCFKLLEGSKIGILGVPIRRPPPLNPHSSQCRSLV